MNHTAKDAIVEALREEGQPLSWDEIENRINSSEKEIEAAITDLIDKRLLRLNPRELLFKLTEWPDESECSICGEEIEPGGHYRIRMEERGVKEPERQSATVHETCANRGMPKGLF